jgi:hypothetical protein
MTTSVDPIAVAAVVVGVLERLGISNTIGGSIAASFAGEPRSTVDIDVVASVGEGQVAALVAALSPDFCVDEEAVRRAVRTRSSFNLIHTATMLKVDIFVAGGTPLDEEQLARRLWIRLGDGVELPIHPPEDILLQKLRWFQLGGGVSDRQWRDVIGIVRVQGSKLDIAYLQRQAPLLGVTGLLAQALAQRDNVD